MERLFCTKIEIPLIEQCMLMSEWAAHWQAVGVVLTVAIGLGGGIKLLFELQRIRKQREHDIALKRTEFFLAQHRRLFDDPDLGEILSYLDGDTEDLKEEETWEKCRKFLIFIEEIELLIRSNMLNPEAAYYMFGYYAKCARDGKNFNTGINASDIHWKLFQDFCKKSDDYFKKNKNGPDQTLHL